MSRRLKFDIPGVDWRRDLKEIVEQSPADLFGVSGGPDLVVEVGFGRGEFLVESAIEQPGRCFLGIELSYKRVLKLARRLSLTEVVNIRLVEARAEAVIREALSGGGVSEFWVNFPDPWPKARHARRRFFQPTTIARLSNRLRLGGRLFVATDDVLYAEQIHLVLAAEPGLTNAYSRNWLEEAPGRRQTAYEREWRADGRRMHFFEYENRESRS